MKTPILCLVVCCSGVFASVASAQQIITTTFVSNGGGSAGWLNVFDVKVKALKGVLITELDINVSEGVGSPVTIEIYTCPMTYLGKEGNVGAWTKVATGNGVAAARDQPSRVDIQDFQLAPGSYGFAIYYVNVAQAYTNGNGTNQSYTNADLDLNLGVSIAGLFVGSVFRPRVCNVTLYYGLTGQAAVSTFGTGCKGSNGVPSLAGLPGSLPKLGTNLTMVFTNLPIPGAAVFVLYGFSDQQMSTGAQLPFDLAGLGAPGCLVYVDPLATSGTVGVNGSAQFIIPIPQTPSLAGVPVYWQGLLLDPGANRLGLTATNGLTAWLGN